MTLGIKLAAQCCHDELNDLSSAGTPESFTSSAFRSTPPRWVHTRGHQSLSRLPRTAPRVHPALSVMSVWGVCLSPRSSPCRRALYVAMTDATSAGGASHNAHNSRQLTLMDSRAAGARLAGLPPRRPDPSLTAARARQGRRGAYGSAENTGPTPHCGDKSAIALPYRL